MMLTPQTGIRCIVLIVTGLSKTLAQWPNWQQQQQPQGPPPPPGMSPTHLWRQQNTGYDPNQAPQGSNVPPNTPPPSAKNALPSFMPPPRGGSSWNQYPLQSPPGWSAQQPNQVPPPSGGANPDTAGSGRPAETNGNRPPNVNLWLPPGSQKTTYQWESQQPYQQWPGGPQNPGSSKEPNSTLVMAINKMTAAFTQFSTSLEKLLTSLGKLTQLQK